MSDADPAPEAHTVVLRSGASFEGVIYLNGPGRIDGALTGEIVAKRAVMIGKGARVRARVDAEEVVVAGAVEGDVLARTRIELRPSGRVWGTLSAPRLLLADGCFFDGDCKAGNRPESRHGAPSPGALARPDSP